MTCDQSLTETDLLATSDENAVDSEADRLNPLAEIITITEVKKHPDADFLDIISPDGSGVNWAVDKLGQFSPGDKAVWIDSVNEPLLNTSNPIFAFLAQKGKEWVKLKPKKLRGIFSRGLLLKIPEGFDPETGDITSFLGIKKAPENFGSRGGSIAPEGTIRGPTHLLERQAYDIEAIFRKTDVLREGDVLYVTEKIHGANAAFGWLPWEEEKDGRKFFGKSKRLWKDPHANSSWAQAQKFHGLEEKLKRYPNHLFFGEIYGPIQDLHYGSPNVTQFIMFDIWDTVLRRWLPFEKVLAIGKELDIPVVPVVATITWKEEWKGNKIPDEIRQMAEGKTLLAGDNIREGVVIRSELIRENMTWRWIYKLVGDGYLKRK